MERNTAKHAMVPFKELGTRCWLPARFLEGARCRRVMECNYPEKKTCKAVYTEIRALNAQLIDCQKRIGEKIAKLVEAIEASE